MGGISAGQTCLGFDVNILFDNGRLFRFLLTIGYLSTSGVFFLFFPSLFPLEFLVRLDSYRGFSYSSSQSFVSIGLVVSYL